MTIAFSFLAKHLASTNRKPEKLVDMSFSAEYRSKFRPLMKSRNRLGKIQKVP